MGGSYPSTAVLIEVLLVSTDQQRITALKYVRFGARLDQP